jgi:MtN3 and saliva related transmembrane protein
MNTLDLLGGLAGSLTTAAFVPQVVKTWKSRSAGDISLGMLLTFCSGVFLWLLYGLLLGSWPLIAANGITLSLASVLLVLQRAAPPSRPGSRDLRRARGNRSDGMKPSCVAAAEWRLDGETGDLSAAAAVACNEADTDPVVFTPERPTAT